MLIKILGIIDILGGIFLIFNLIHYFPNQAILIFGLIFLAKSCLGLLKDLGSWIDFLVGIVFLLSIIISIPQIIMIILGILVIQKGVFSLL